MSMSFHGGAPSWVHRQNEAALQADAARFQARVSQLETENAALRDELEKIKRKYEECKNQLERR